MKLGIKKYEELVAYLRGEMNPEDQAMYSRKLQENPELQQEVERFSILIQQVQTVGLQVQIQHIHQRLDRIHLWKMIAKWLIGSFLLAGVAIGSYWWITNNPIASNPTTVLQIAASQELTQSPITQAVPKLPSESSTRYRYLPDIQPIPPPSIELAPLMPPKVGTSILPDLPANYSSMIQAQLRAEQLIGEGIKLYESGRWLIARDRIQNALEMEQDSTIALEFLDKIDQIIAQRSVFIPAANYTMGRDKGDKIHQPAHEVHLDAFYVTKAFVTTQEYCDFLNQVSPKGVPMIRFLDWENTSGSIDYDQGRYLPKSGREDLTVVGASWYGAEAYAQFHGMRLITEAEWEYLTNLYLKKGLPPDFQTEIQGFYSLDRSGEWCADWFGANYYQRSPSGNPTGPATGKSKVIREAMSSSIDKNTGRAYDSPWKGHHDISFRCVFILK